MRKIYLLLLALLLLAMSVVPSLAQGGSVVDVVTNTNEFSTLAAAIEAADPSVAETLSTGGPYTVFAPTNDAFVRLAQFFDFEMEDLLADTDALTQLLMYHVIEGEVFSGQAFALIDQSEDGQVLVPTLLDGTGVSLSNVDGELTLNQVAEVVLPDIDADNGVVHGINDVVFPGVLRERLENLGGPVTNTIADVVDDMDGFSILSAVIEAGDTNQLLTVGFPFTFFAPNDDAFNAVFEELGLTQEEALAQPELLSTILRHHAVEEEFSGEELVALVEDEMADDDEDQAATLESVQGEDLTLTLVTPEVEEPAAEEGEAEATEEAPPETNLVINDTATVIETDISADNGVVHVVDAVLIPQEAMDQLRVIQIDPATIAGILRDREDLTTLRALMEETDAIDLLDIGFPFTLFAPTDEAFEAFFSEMGTSRGLVLADPELANLILRYHILEEELTQQQLVDSSGTEFETVEGQTLTVTASGDTVMVNDATVVEADVDASNGVIHVTDSVLVPQSALDMMGAGEEPEATEEAEMEATEESEAEATEEADMEETEEASADMGGATVSDLVSGDANFSTLVSIVDATESSDMLVSGGPFTIFSPTNAAFDGLFAQLGVTADMALGLPELLEPVLLYHIVEGNVSSSDLADMDGQTITTLQGEELTITVNADGSISLSSPGATVNIESADMEADNGVIHAIDGVLIPQQTIDELSALGIELGG